ncbi:MAG: class I SAM-dependent methyltransferase [Ignavibacteriaceae bacterium]
MQKTDYGKIANTYNKRYVVNYLENIEKELKNLISTNNYKNILEAGCGTGRWIKSLDQNNLNVFGIDYSLEMLGIPKQEKCDLNIVNANALEIPFKDNFFDLIFCINAIHHFPDKKKFVEESKRTLANKGMLAVFGVDPHIDKDWYVYNYFDGVYENDLKRFPSLEQLKILLSQIRFENIEIKIVEKVLGKRVGQDVFEDPFLEKHGNSQLANLTEDEYQKGIEKIKHQTEKNPQTVFTTSVIFYLVTAKKI